MTQKKLKLTAVGIPALPARHRPYPDHLVAGLGLRVGTSRRTWLLRYRSGGRKLSPVLGYHPSMSLAEAREAARKLMERVDFRRAHIAAGSTPARRPDAWHPDRQL